MSMEYIFRRRGLRKRYHGALLLRWYQEPLVYLDHKLSKNFGVDATIDATLQCRDGITVCTPISEQTSIIGITPTIQIQH
jgi:hypothetical protein